MAQLIICPLSRVEALGRRYKPAAMLSLLSAPQAVPHPASLAAGGYLQLNFHDISMIMPNLRCAQAEQIAELLSFGRRWRRGARQAQGSPQENGKPMAEAENAANAPAAPLLIHCQMGISRSTAAAYCLACALRPDISEAAWAKTLRERAPEATPNPHIIALADKALNRGGRMSAAIAALGRGRSAFEGAPFTLEV